jgi:chaperonin cofactor prefoldin
MSVRRDTRPDERAETMTTETTDYVAQWQERVNELEDKIHRLGVQTKKLNSKLEYAREMLAHVTATYGEGMPA